MRITFEKTDIVQMLRQVLGYDITDDDVVITADPFEVQVSHVDVDRLAQKPPETPELSAELLRSLQQIPQIQTPEKDEDPEPVEEEILTMEDILARNSSLSTKNPLGNTTRPLGPDESEDPPPISEDELYGRRRRK